MLTLAALIFTEQIRLWQILAASLLGGAVVGVKLPCRMALTLDVAGRGNLLSAMAANFAATNVIGIFIPLLGGQVGSRFHIGWAYIIMGIAFASSAVVIYNLRGVAGAGERRNSPWHDLKSGVRFAFTTPVVRTLILTSLVAELFGWAHEPMLPVMARDVMGVGLGGLGYLMSAASAGAFISMLTVSNVGDFKHKGWLLVGGLAGYGVFLMLFAASPWSPVAAFPLALVLLALAYASAMAAEAAMGTLIQTIVPDEMRGRVLSFQVMTWGVTGLSGFHTGAIATLLGAPLAIAIGGGVLALNALRLARRVSRLQPVEQKSRASE